MIQALPVYLLHEFSRRRSGFRDGIVRPGVLQTSLARGLSSSPETVWYFCRRSFTGNFSESCRGGGDRAHRAFPARRSTSGQDDGFSQRPRTRCRRCRVPTCIRQEELCQRLACLRQPCGDEQAGPVWERLRASFWRKKAHLFAYTPPAAATSNYARQSLLTCAISAAPIVIPTRS